MYRSWSIFSLQDAGRIPGYDRGSSSQMRSFEIAFTIVKKVDVLCS
jgi:hypothetical protein